MDTSTFTVAQLKEDLKKRNIPFGSRALKAELKSLLQASIDKSSSSTAIASRSGSGTKRARSESVEAAGPSSTTKKRKKSSPSPSKSTTSTSTASTATKATSKSSSKPKAPVPTPKPFLPLALLTLIKTHIPCSPSSLRTHLALAGTSQLIRDTCYASDAVWKGLAMGAGYGRPSVGLGGIRFGSARVGSWRGVVRDVANCKAFGNVLDNEEGEATWNTVLASAKTFTVLKPEAFVEQNAFVEINSLLTIPNGRPSSIKSLLVQTNQTTLELASCPSVAYALACYPPLEIMSVKTLADKHFNKQFSYANNSDGVTVHDFWSAVCKSGQDTVPERDLFPIFLASNPHLPKSRTSWTDEEYEDYEDWLEHDMNGAHVRRCATLLDTMAPGDAMFDGDIDQLGQGCLLFSVGMDY